MLVNNHEHVVEKMTRPKWVVNGKGRQSGNIQGTFREHSGTVREYSQEDDPRTGGQWRKASRWAAIREHSRNIRGRFREHSGNIRGTFGEHSGTIREHSEENAPTKWVVNAKGHQAGQQGELAPSRSHGTKEKYDCLRDNPVIGRMVWNIPSKRPSFVETCRLFLFIRPAHPPVLASLHLLCLEQNIAELV